MTQAKTMRGHAKDSTDNVCTENHVWERETLELLSQPVDRHCCPLH